nr:reverse transcriptase domain-containing protein [Tanacetum cinerariifolium]
MVPNTEKLMEAFIGGLPRSIEGNITASKPQTFEEAINIAQRLMDQLIKHNSTQDTNDHKQKFDDKNIIDNNNYPNDRNNNYQNNHNNHNHNNDHHHQQNRKQETFKTYVSTNGYNGNRPLCERCTLHHIGPCSVKCQNYNRAEILCSLMILGSLKKSKNQIIEDLKPREQDTRRTNGNTTRIDPFLPSLILEAQTQVLNVLLLLLHPYNVYMILNKIGLVV